MARLWSLLRGSEKRAGTMTLDDYAKLLQSSPYPVGWMNRGISNAYEDPDEEFQTYVYQAFKTNGIVFACMLTRQLVFSEARFQFQRMRDGKPGDLYGTQDLAILETPWPNGTTGDLLSRAIQDVDLAGNHYMLREKGGRLRRLRPDWVKIILTAAPDEAVQSDVAGYLYMPGGTGTDSANWEIYPIDGSRGAVAHWSPIPDPDAQYKGMSWLTPIMREIMADKQATTHKAKFFENAATPNLAVTFKESVTNEQFKEFMEIMDSQKGGVEHAYETLYLGGGADVTTVGADMRQMDFRQVIGGGEVRIAAAARVHPVIVGLSDALTGSSLNAGNYGAAKRQFGDGTMRPLWRSLCAAYEVLLPKRRDSRLWYDDRDIEFLRADKKDDAEVARIQSQTISSLVMAGYEPDTIIKAILDEDLNELQHTGNLSVQLLPGSSNAMNAQSVMMKTLAEAGYSLESIIAAVEGNDIGKLVKAPVPPPEPAAPAAPAGKKPATPPAGTAKPAAKPATTPAVMPKKKPSGPQNKGGSSNA